MLNDFSAESKVLFVGEGNFSFSASVVENIILKLSQSKQAIPVQKVEAEECKVADQFTVSCYEDEKFGSEVKQKNLDSLRSNGCKIIFELDATELHKDSRTLAAKYTDVIFMFPHVGGKMRIEKNRALLFAFLSSCRCFIHQT